MREEKVFYHYTCSYLLSSIIKSGFLTLTVSNFDLGKMDLYPVVWLTTSKSPDHHGLLFDPQMPDDLNKTHIRFTIRKRPYIQQWDKWSDGKGMDKTLKQVLIQSALAQGTYQDWYISEQPIPLATDVICVENLVTRQKIKF
jgi:hypothetical protein